MATSDEKSDFPLTPLDLDFERDKSSSEIRNSPILCIHCKRTKDNGIRCRGICVADNDY
tara:strand:+ start:349 stop:525 length:177 start_codon:yes stop_codon:yes gene_type:complete